jgi:hypothetical protein
VFQSAGPVIEALLLREQEGQLHLFEIRPLPGAGGLGTGTTDWRRSKRAMSE